ncbi:multidrug efflux pump [Dongia mobilis]|uniref:Multidrug efflux pump n=1 Tax=Dongia mobilis TaxID=578943 RepID=A0A4R6WQJ5_9PROT|nr:efflux RND transporter permease subunit [Dongia mobilis]TDQ80553.1 multidrug efflux pump [Dongia mobilis]
MRLPELCIRRPVFATVINLIVLLVGMIAYDRLAVREYPNIDEPIVSVRTDFRGASAEIIEIQVTQPLEESLSGIEGIDFISSTSRAESSRISITFRPDRDIDSAAADVRDRVSRARGRLPADVEEPIIAKVEADAQPIIWMAFTSELDSPLQISDYVERFVKNRLQTLTGISEVRIFGERKPAMRIWLKPERLAAFALTVQDVESAIRAQNLEMPAGTIESQAREFSVLSDTSISTPEQFAAIIVGRSNQALVRLGDVADIALGAYSDDVRARINGKSGVTLGIIKQSTANPLDVSNAIRAALPGIQESLPPGMNLELAYDSSTFIARSIDNVYRTIGEAVVLVLLVIVFFLRSVRATIIPLVTIPLSLVGACALMYAMGFTLNTLTMLSFVLAIGLVVDDAIVMLENIHRHIEEGLSPLKAALVGSREIAFAVLAMTITLAAVYVPVALQTGRTGKLFTEFALTLAGAVLISGFVALTLSPMMCAKLLPDREHEKHGPIYRAIEALLDALTAGYRASLQFCMKVRWLIVLLLLGVAASAIWLVAGLRQELTPVEDRGLLFASVTGPEGATLDYTSRYVEKLESIIAPIPEVNAFNTVTGNISPSQAMAPIRLKPWEERERKSREIAASLRGPLNELPGVRAVVNVPPSLGGRPNQKAAEIVILSTGTYEELDAVAQAMVEAADADPRIANPDSDLKLSKPEIRLSVDRDKAADLGIDVDRIGATIETLLAGRDVTRFKRDGRQYEVLVQVDNRARTTPDQAKLIYVRAAGGAMVPLSNLVSIRETVAPKDLNRWNQLRAATISANAAPGYTSGEALQALQEIAVQTLPGGMQIDYAGQSREFISSTQSGVTVFLLALAFIYLVLSAQFESFRDPFVIMLTVPLAVTGALIAMHLTGGTLNVYSQIGLVTLIGLITKHGILIVEFANQRRDSGADRIEAAIDAAVLRLRPILMTTGAMVLGTIPLALAEGAGSESRQAIGWVIVGGLTFGSFFTLYVVPVAYSLIAARVSGSVDRQLSDQDPVPPGDRGTVPAE